MTIKQFTKSIARTKPMRIARLVEYPKDPRYIHLTGYGKFYVIFGDDESIKDFITSYTDTSKSSITYQI